MRLDLDPSKCSSRPSHNFPPSRFASCFKVCSAYYNASIKTQGEETSSQGREIKLRNDVMRQSKQNSASTASVRRWISRAILPRVRMSLPTAWAAMWARRDPDSRSFLLQLLNIRASAYTIMHTRCCAFRFAWFVRPANSNAERCSPSEANGLVASPLLLLELINLRTTHIKLRTGGGWHLSPPGQARQMAVACTENLPPDPAACITLNTSPNYR